ncbi:protein FAM241B-like [Saccoglossus kowalevskii]|uniref:Uncharacterized protein C10orf35 homolog n=1 Tax=Saccoglossus kowalevskii TaxID=10224 RepID=A0ABM0GWK5_SACKO|nr:PREDICTED: uncharacterized protein C10orf35 homolog [Saccoglossus kowalevskii]
MVRILANGDIVQDDDPRARSSTGRQRDTQSNRPRQGYVQHEDHNQYGGGGQQVSIIDVGNQKLLDAGFPRWNLGPYVVEPIATVGMLLAMMFFGLQGLLFAGLLFFAVKWSQQTQGRRQ